MNSKEFYDIRMSLGLTQDELANGLGIGRQTISQYETGFRTPGKTVSLVMRVLHGLPKDRAKKLFKLFINEAKQLESGNSGKPS